MVIEKQKMIEVQEKEIVRKQKELEATVSRPADAERYRVETLANAKRVRKAATLQGAAARRRHSHGDDRRLARVGVGADAA